MGRRKARSKRKGLDEVYCHLPTEPMQITHPLQLVTRRIDLLRQEQLKRLLGVGETDAVHTTALRLRALSDGLTK